MHQSCIEVASDNPSHLIHVHDPKCEGDCEYGCHYPIRISPGDRLYVRETWQAVTCDMGLGVNTYYYYRATDKLNGSYDHWCPSIFMPKSAARIWLNVVSVRPERAMDITEEDARMEGFESRAAFLAEWMRIYGEWTVSFWVWVIEFKREQL